MTFRWIAILLANICFYILAGVQGLYIALGSLILVYISGIILERITKYRRIVCFIYLALQVGMLLCFKYEIFDGIATPMAISFYTLVCIGYVIDVYRGKYKAERNSMKLACVLFFFPTMAQGPICRYDDIKNKIADAGFEFRKVSYGLTKISYGLFKKMVIADRLAIIFHNLNGINNGTAIAANIIVYAFYLYSDFSGGIDIAIGIGYIMGIKLPDNFNNPFLAKSISEYWRRWHMSLGTWLRDYVFYPISFSKPVVKLSKLIKNKLGYKISKKVPIYIATLIVWLVTGLWHGANANFILWGMLNAVIILISIELEPLYDKFQKKCTFATSKAYSIFRVLRTFLLMGMLRMLDYNTVSGYFKALYLMVTDFSLAEFSNISWAFATKADAIIILIGLFIMLVVGMCKEKSDYNKIIFNKGVVLTYSVIAVLIAVIIIFGMYGIGYEGKDFIYIRY